MTPKPVDLVLKFHQVDVVPGKEYVIPESHQMKQLHVIKDKYVLTYFTKERRQEHKM